MKTLANRLVLFAASTFVFGTMAYGQTNMTATIPFAFQTSNASLPSGDYRIYVNRQFSGAVIVTFSNVATQKSSAMTGRLDVPNWASEAKPHLTFVCGPETCSLRQIGMSEGTLNYKSPRKIAANEHVASIAIRVAHGD